MNRRALLAAGVLAALGLWFYLSRAPGAASTQGTPGAQIAAGEPSGPGTSGQGTPAGSESLDDCDAYIGEDGVLVIPICDGWG